MRKIVGIVMLSLLASGMFSSLNAQGYSSGIGLRGAFSSGITFKHFVSDDAALEGILSTIYRGYVITGLYEKHAMAFGQEGLNWFYGGGAHIGYFDGTRFERRNGGFYQEDVMTLGVDLILGIEYFIGDIPITVGLDVKPYFDLVNPGPDYVGGGISLRYVW